MPVRSNSHLSSCFQAPSRLTGSCRCGARCLPPPGAGAVGRLAHDGPPTESRRRVAARHRSRARVLGASTLGRGGVLARAGPAVLGCGALASADRLLHGRRCTPTIVAVATLAQGSTAVSRRGAGLGRGKEVVTHAYAHKGASHHRPERGHRLRCDASPGFCVCALLACSLLLLQPP
jgi:hypothetical protein